MDKNILDDTVLNERQLEYAGFWIRVGAALIDALILSPLYILIYYNNVTLKSMALMLILVISANAYKPFLEYSRQATFGKQLLNIKVVNEELGRITLKQSLLRFLPWIVIGLLGILSSVYVFNHDEFSAAEDMFSIGQLTQESPIYLLSQIVNFIFMLSLLKVAFNSMKRGIHDDLANTYCIIDSK